VNEAEHAYLSCECLHGVLSPKRLKSSNINILFSVSRRRTSVVESLWTRNTSQHPLPVSLYLQPNNTDQRRLCTRKQNEQHIPSIINAYKEERERLSCRWGSAYLRSHGLSWWVYLIGNINVRKERGEVTVNGGMRGWLWSYSLKIIIINIKRKGAPFFKNTYSSQLYTAS